MPGALQLHQGTARTFESWSKGFVFMAEGFRIGAAGFRLEGFWGEGLKVCDCELQLHRSIARLVFRAEGSESKLKINTL